MTSTLGRLTSPCAEAHTKGLLEYWREGAEDGEWRGDEGFYVGGCGGSEASLSHYRPVGPENKKDEMAKLVRSQLDPSGSSLASCPPQRDKRHWANQSYQVALPINDGEPPSQHLWNNHDGAGIKVMPMAPQVYGNYTTMGTGTDPSLLIMILLMVQRTTVNWATFGGIRLDIPCFALLCSSLVCAVANCGCNSLGSGGGG
ncbi:hypothetical protein THAOC_22408 [Thalassiosira oceanica]|uniref:Uncharacterized protein n=1 Tax=Thalassiosira oceanica TaxID=159749 RepID=K0SG10_THAOC|nr:hypothetical protein THAOC_22408 [Thalassiosira oceanica]|eukprot:EJK57537.1 hypothetical protein THAOC_22408 [Thalassiosira oceanica]